MAVWTSLASEVLWRNALAVIPLALLVAICCRWFRCRPATRHTLWLIVLVWFLVPSLLPQLRLPYRLPILSAASSPNDHATTGRGPGAEPTIVRDLDPAGQFATGLAGAEAPVSFSIHPTGPTRSGPTSQPPRPEAKKGPKTRPIYVRGDQADHPAGRTTVEHPARDPGRFATTDPTGLDKLSPSLTGAVVAMPDAGAVSAILDPERSRRAKPALPPTATDDVSAGISEYSPAERREGRPAAATTGPAGGSGERWHHWVAGLVRVRDALAGLPPIPSTVWLGGTALIMLGGLFQLCCFGWRIRATEPAPSSVTRVVTDAASRLGLRRPPEVLTVRDCISPMIWCGRRTRLILPASLWAQLDHDGRRAVVFHELAHLRRGDHWVARLELIIGCLFWWHPLLWWVRRRLHEEAELCCDAWVTWLMPRSRRAYAQALVATKSYIQQQPTAVPPVGIGVMTGRAKRFARRITMVMTESVRPRLSVSGLAAALILAVVGWVAVPAWAGPPKHKCDKPPKPPKAAKLIPAPPDVPPPDPFLYTLVGGKSKGDVEKRLDHLEQNIEKLTKKIEKLSQALSGGKRQKEKEAFVVTPGMPASAGEAGWRTYQLPKGKLADFTELMVRQDVPILVRPGKEAIEIQANKAQHTMINAFIKMIGGSNETIIRSYPLPEGKLEALSTLMVRDDVPVLVSPKKDSIALHGSEIEQFVFKAFVGMINPGEERRAAAPAKGKYEAALSSFEKHLQSGAEKQTEQGLIQAQYQSRADAEALKAQWKSLMQRAKSMAAKAEMLEAQANALEDEAEDRDGRERIELRAQAAEMEAKAEALEEQAEALEEAAKALKQAARALDD